MRPGRRIRARGDAPFQTPLAPGARARPCSSPEPRRPRVAWSWALVATLGFAAPPAFACGEVDPPTLEDDFRDADEVFLARLSSYSKQPHPTNERTVHEFMSYELVEVFRGSPPERGEVRGSDLNWEEVTVFDSCHWSFLGEKAEGRTAILFVRHETHAGPVERWIQRRSTFHPSGDHSGDVLEQIAALRESDARP